MPDVKFGDWPRMFFGEVPAEFYIELIIRSFLVYLLLQVSMRLLGKRMARQLSRLDLAAMVALSSSIGVAMLSPINGMLPAFIIALFIIGISRTISYFSTKSEKFATLTQGDISTLVLDGVLQLDTMENVRITRDMLFAQLRSAKIKQLGKVNRVYMEADGSFSIVKSNNPKPGLLLLPEWDDEYIHESLSFTDQVICKNCGAEKNAADCGHCHSSESTNAVVEK